MCSAPIARASARTAPELHARTRSRNAIESAGMNGLAPMALAAGVRH